MARAGAGLESVGLREVVEKQFDLLQRALAFNQVIATQLKSVEEAALRNARGGFAGNGAPRHSCPTHSALVSALVPLQRDSSLAASEKPKSALPPSAVRELAEPLLPPCIDVIGFHADHQGALMSRQTSMMSRQCSGSDTGSVIGKAPKLKQPRTLFPSADGLKARVLEALRKPEYRVEALYKEHGICQRIAASQCFQNLTLVVIALNTVWIAIETDYNKADVLCQAPRIFQVVDNLFCSYFTFEILTRFFAFRRKLDAFGDAWFVFDLVLVLLMAWETWAVVALYKMYGTEGDFSAGHASVLRILRMFRLTRVARMTRLLRGMPELMILVKGMFEGIRSVSATLVLLVFIIYVFAVMFVQLLSGTEVAEGCFNTVPEAMNCLLLEGVFTEQAEFIRKLLAADWKYYVFMLVYLLFASLTVMNMLIAVLCEVVSVVAQVDKEENQLQELKSKIADLVSSLGVADADQVITKDHLSRLTENAEAMRSLHEMGVDVLALVDLADFIFRENSILTLGDFMEVVLQFRGSNTATVKDVVDMRKFVTKELADLEVRLVRGKA
uniref:Ion transport domain-containing protein n=1 Tax=Alexandrium catenella TaxID=2925 RepID=A0A7S1L2C6_ALECA|mmetsp:Transcript_105142/g.279824  ORF Transcript_105142/g.279824 Transcript_105142/m.279824 type:complete len:557 (+) Transcript_105142:82-1752(+)